MPQNPRGICVGRDLWRSSGLILHSEQDQLEQAAECYVNFWILLRMKFYHFSQKVLYTPRGEQGFSWCLCCNDLSTDTGFLQRLLCFHLRRYSKAASVWFWETCSRWPWLNRATGQDDLHRYFPTSTLCDSVVSNRISFAASCCITLTSEKSGSAFPVPFPSGNSRQQLDALLTFCSVEAQQIKFFQPVLVHCVLHPVILVAFPWPSSSLDLRRNQTNTAPAVVSQGMSPPVIKILKY